MKPINSPFFKNKKNMELNTAFNQKAHSIVKQSKDKAKGVERAEGYQEGATDMLNAIEKMLNNMLQDLYTKEEKEGIKDVLKYLHTVKPLNTETK